jgi:hypothetical protein
MIKGLHSSVSVPHSNFLIIDAVQERKATGGKGGGINSGEQKRDT